VKVLEEELSIFFGLEDLNHKDTRVAAIVELCFLFLGETIAVVGITDDRGAMTKFDSLI